ncbi:MAG: CbtA family protein [Nitrososphaera sp.]|nr:CbtA family protein [Nitrososphaera sp.]
MAPLQTGRIFALSIVAGLVSGGILAGLSQAVIRPYTDALADLFIDELIADGAFDEEEFDAQLQSIYFSQTAGAVAIGLGGGALIGGVYALSKRSKGRFRDAIVIAAVAWFVLYVVPAVKYPPSPSAMFYPEVASVYYPLYGGYLAVSGLAALGIAAGFRKIALRNKIFAMAALYLSIVAGAFFVFPDYDLDASYPQPLVYAWRAVISAAVTAYWFIAGVLCGYLWTFWGAGARAKTQTV